MARLHAVLLVLCLSLSGCASWDRIWNGREVTATRTSTPATASSTVGPEVVDRPDPQTEPAEDGDPLPDEPAPTSSMTSSTSEASTPESGGPASPASSSSSSASGPGSDIGGSCDGDDALEQVAQARILLGNLTVLRIAETVAGYVNGSYVRESRLFDLANASFVHESYTAGTAVAAVGSNYSVHGPNSHRGRDDGPPLARRLAERMPGANASLAPWLAAPATSLDVHCDGAEVVSSSHVAPVVTMRIRDGVPLQATVKGEGVNLEITYTLSPGRVPLDFALPPSPVPVMWQTMGNSSLVLQGDHRALDGHLVLHAVDVNGYSIQAVALNGSLSSSRDASFLAYHDDGDGLWGPGDRVTWGGRAASLRLLDSWAGAFAATP